MSDIPQLARDLAALSGTGMLIVHVIGFVVGWWVYGRTHRAVVTEMRYYREKYQGLLEEMAKKLGVDA